MVERSPGLKPQTIIITTCNINLSISLPFSPPHSKVKKGHEGQRNYFPFSETGLHETRLVSKSPHPIIRMGLIEKGPAMQRRDCDKKCSHADIQGEPFQSKGTANTKATRQSFSRESKKLKWLQQHKQGPAAEQTELTED